MRSLVRLYPASWRARYGDEFEALLEERPLGPFDVADILLAAIDAHLRPRRSTASGGDTKGSPMTPRNGGVAAIIGGAFWLISLAGSSATQPQDGQPWVTLFVVALIALVVAVVALSAHQGRRQPGLMWLAVALPIIGAAVSGAGLLGMALIRGDDTIAGISPWNVWALGIMTTLIGSGLFAIASLRIRTLSRGGSALLAVGALAAVPALMGIAFAEILGEAGSVLGILGIFAFAAGWIWLGVSAIRSDRAGGIAFGDAIP